MIVRNPKGNTLSAKEIANWANEIDKSLGCAGTAYTEDMFDQLNPLCRLHGSHCSCGETPSGLSNGDFKLLPADSDEVKDGLKPYMICINCGAYSHL